VPNVRLLAVSQLGDQAVGDWILEAGVAAFRRQALEGRVSAMIDRQEVNTPAAAATRFMDQQRYLHVGTITWRVVRKIQLVNAGGQYAERVDPGRLHQVRVDLADL
jgi:hypothetical protein